MALDRITCPECGAGLKSKTGFTVGKTVNCPKCETAFTVEDPDEEGEEEAEEVKPAKKKPAKAAVEDDDEGEDDAPKKKKKKKKKKAADYDEWSYKKSWIRYAVLGVLVIVLGVLVYFLYEKKKKEAARADPVPAAVTRTAAAAG